MTTIATVKSNAVSTFNGLTLLKGKGITALEKAQHLETQGASLGSLAAVGVARKAIHAKRDSEALYNDIYALAGGDIRPAALLVTAKSGRAVTILENQVERDGVLVFNLDGSPKMRAPFSEFLRMRAALEALPQLTATGKPTPAKKALELWRHLKAEADIIRSERQALQALKVSEA